MPALVILAQPLAGGGLVAGMVEQVVGDLEGQADVAGIAAIRRARLGRDAAHDAGGLDRELDQRAGLQLLQPGDRADVELLPLGDQVEHLPSGHALRARGARHFQHQIGPDERILMGCGVGDDLERQVVKAIAGQHRGRFVEGAVDGRLAAAQIVIVHARQVVVDQRIDVDRLDRRTGADDPLLVQSEQPAGGDGQQRADALAAAQPGMAHRLEQPVAAVAWPDQIAGKDRLDLGADAVGLGLKLGVGHAASQAASNGFMPCGWPSGPSAICSIRACAALSRASQCRFSRSPRW